MEEMPKTLETPSLRVCQIANSKLVLPRDVRQMFMQDPVWAPEWRELLVKFDEQWGGPAQTSTSTPPTGPTASNVGQVPSGQPKEQSSIETKVEACQFDWTKVFPGEPTQLEAVKSKFGAENIVELPAIGNTSFLVCPGPVLFILLKKLWF